MFNVSFRGHRKECERRVGTKQNKNSRYHIKKEKADPDGTFCTVFICSQNFLPSPVQDLRAVNDKHVGFIREITVSVVYKLRNLEAMASFT